MTEVEVVAFCCRSGTDDIILFPGNGGAAGAVGVAKDAVAATGVGFGDAPFFEEGFPFGTVKFLLGSVDPAGGHPQRVGGIHQVAHDQRGIFQSGVDLCIIEDNADSGSTVEGVGAFPAHNGGIHGFQLFDGLGILKDDDLNRLFCHATVGIGTCQEDLLQGFLFYLLGQIAAAASSFQEAFHYFVHGGTFLSFLDFMGAGWGYILGRPLP